MSGRRFGEAFNPYRAFHSYIIVPEGLVSYDGLSAGAKLCYGALSKHAGKGGKCFPGVSTLAKELGVSERQTQYYLCELEAQLFIRRDRRVGEHRSSTFNFLWHKSFVG